MTVCRVVVVGAGVSGLVAARELTKHPELEVICLEGSDRVGGQLHTLEIDGAAVDVGAEAIHLGAPHVAALVRELGLAEHVVGAARGASVMGTRKGLRPLPAGVGPTGPTKIWPVLKSGILTPRGLLRAGLEPLMARRRVPEDVTVGSFTQGRFGKEVTDTFVDPLLGNLHGGDVHRLSLQATAPQLVADASNGTSMLLKNLHLPAPLAGLAARVRRTPAPGSPRPGASRGGSALPMFATWPGGLQELTAALAAEVDVRTDARVTGLEREGQGWRVLVEGQEPLLADHVLLTAPGAASAELLREHCPQAAALYDHVPMASVATVVLGYEPAAATANPTLRDHNGILLPSNLVRTFKAATNLSRKWPGLGARHHLMRASVGRFGSSLAEELTDEQMTRRVADEISDLTGLAARPELAQVHRWPASMPQLQPGHKDRVEAARDALATVGGITIAGCSVDGLGIGSTVKSGQQAAREIITTFKDKD